MSSWADLGEGPLRGRTPSESGMIQTDGNPERMDVEIVGEALRSIGGAGAQLGRCRVVTPAVPVSGARAAGLWKAQDIIWKYFRVTYTFVSEIFRNVFRFFFLRFGLFFLIIETK